MTHSALEHVVRAPAAITNERHVVVIGSQAVLEQPALPARKRSGRKLRQSRKSTYRRTLISWKIGAVDTGS